MSWTYSGNPGTSDLDTVRFLLGDTETNDPLLQDEEITYLLTSKGSTNAATQQACLVLMAKAAREVDYTIGPEKVEAGKRLEAYRSIMKELKASALSSNAVPSWDDATVYREPIFDIGMHDSPGSGSGLDG